MSKKEKITQFFRIYESEETKKIFERNEYQANRLSAFVLIVSAVVLVISWVLNIFDVFTVPKVTMNLLAIQGLIEISVPLVLFKIFNGKNSWLKYVMVLALLLVCMRLFSVLNHNVILIMVLPVLLSSRYFSKGFTINISIVSLIALAIASASTAVYGIIDLNFYPAPDDGTMVLIKNGLRASLTALGADTSAVIGRIMLHAFLPRLLVFMVITLIAVRIAEHGHNMVIEQEEVSRESASVKAELDTANLIQNGMVPNIFPAFPERDEFDIYAAMYTAKEVGGDFYDFFLIDEDHLAMVIADVSGKGVPAALFMMATKILIGDRTLVGGSPSEILEFVNNRICGNNQAEMFVTVWLGILDIKTGKVIASNAGHEYPAICHKGGEFEVLKDKHSFILGGMENMKYRQYEFTLNKGDSIFVYTDGVTEAHNENEELFGENRMTEALNIAPDAKPEEIISCVKSEVEKFVGNAERFDDITMLCLKYMG